jgi:beta-lactam-binding protein with PASTA domain/predicted Ser/Thr protein kinase
MNNSLSGGLGAPPVHFPSMGTTLSDPLVGQLLDGRYRVNRRLARGGMATVYEAVDTRLERIVAVKVMHPGLAEDRAFVERFIREARSAARLSHPAAVAVFDQSADSGHVFLAMEYVQGRTLRDWLRDKVRLTPREAFSVMEPVLAALGAAHAAGLVHRDIKPENVLIADDGRVKVADFGLARAVSTSSTTGTALIGTVAYLSPEQVERGVADPRSDVYSAGILLYEMLTGAQPFGGETPIQVAYQHVNYDVPPPSASRESLPYELDQLVVRATRRDPDTRPEDATAFLAEVVRVRRSLTQAQLDTADIQPGVAAAGSTPTLVVPRAGAGEGDPPPVGPAVPPHHTAPVLGGGSGGDPYSVPARFARRRRRGAFALILVLIAALAIGLGAWRVAAGSSLQTPSLIGMSKSEAKAKTAEAGLDLKFAKDEQFSETVPDGQVISTDPQPGRRVARHGTITAVLSKGPERYQVPDLKNVTRTDAENRLRDGHFTVGSAREEFSDGVDEGSVIRTEPKAGESLKRDTVVTLIVSKGQKPVSLPNVVGKAYDEAAKILDRLGFNVHRSDQFNDQTPAGLVIQQDPSADPRATRGQNVDLVVSNGPEITQVTVPSLVGMKLSDARQALAAVGLTATVDEFPGRFGGGRVIRQDPPAGTVVESGTSVGLTVF